MEKNKLKRIIAVCLLSFGILLPVLCQAAVPTFYDVLENVVHKNPQKKKCKGTMVAAGIPYVTDENLQKIDGNQHRIKMWSRIYRCKICGKKHTVNIAETEKHKYPDYAYKTERNQRDGCIPEEVDYCNKKHSVHTHYRIAYADYFYYKCQCGNIKKEIKNMRWGELVHDKPTDIPVIK